MLLFALSAALLLTTAGAILRWFPNDHGLRFWILLAAINLQLTTLHLLTSIFNALTPPGFLIAQAALLAITLWSAPRIARRLGASSQRIPRPFLDLLRWPGWRSPVSAVLTILVLPTLGLSLAEQLTRPVAGFDERMYNCSRVLYWLQHHNIWPWPTHNDAQVDFPIGSEVFFSWPLLFTHKEWMGRLIYWFGYPAAIGGVYALTRLLDASRAGAMAAALAFATTPTVLYLSGVNQKQDIWTAAMLLGFTFWLIRCWKHDDNLGAFLTGLFAILAINVKITCAVVAPFALIAAFVSRGGTRAIRRRLGFQAGGVTMALILSGLALTMAQNLQRKGHPFGSPAAARAVAPDWSAKQLYAHAIRSILLMAELPVHPTQAFRTWWTHTGTEALYRLDAHRALPGERRGGWPGYFVFDAGPPHDSRAYRFSLGGMAFLLAMVFGLLRTFQRVVIGKPDLRGTTIALLVATVQFAALIFLLRWAGGAAERYLIAPYAIGLAAIGASIANHSRARAWVGATALVILGLAAAPSLTSIWDRHRDLRATPVAPHYTDAPFTEAVSKLPKGARIFLVCNRNAREYALFLPKHDFPNQVFPWGRTKFDEPRLRAIVEDNHITHALFERDDRVGFHWYPGISVAGMVAWFQSRPDFREVPLDSPGQRLFERIPSQ
jgi:hypothetical protein